MYRPVKCLALLQISVIAGGWLLANLFRGTMKMVWHESLHVSRPPHRVCSAAFVWTDRAAASCVDPSENVSGNMVLLFVVLIVHHRLMS